MRGLFLLFALYQTVHSSCPSGFDLIKNGECRGLYAKVETKLDNGLYTAVSKCEEIQGQPAIIHDEEHEAYYTSKAEGFPVFTVLGLACNFITNQWEWNDGSELDYKPRAGYDPALNSPCKNGWTWFIDYAGQWAYGNGSMYNHDVTVKIYCATQLQQPTGDGCDSFADDSDDALCYQVYDTSESWEDAQQTCRNSGSNVASIHNAQENSFIRRLAVSAGAHNGVFIGAASTGNNQYGWIDGTPWDYQNFYPGFPIAGHGYCLGMDTFSSSGQWMNMNCDTKMAVACAKKAEPRRECTSGPYKEGETIYTPGYPYDASQPCDYFISVAAGKKVQVEVILLEANTCCDQLVMEDDVLAGNIVANLTGEISNQFYTTKASNLMRVSWQPNGGVNVRGAMFTFTGV